MLFADFSSLSDGSLSQLGVFDCVYVGREHQRVVDSHCGRSWSIVCWEKEREKSEKSLTHISLRCWNEKMKWIIISLFSLSLRFQESSLKMLHEWQLTFLGSDTHKSPTPPPPPSPHFSPTPSPHQSHTPTPVHVQYYEVFILVWNWLSFSNIFFLGEWPWVWIAMASLEHSNTDWFGCHFCTNSSFTSYIPQYFSCFPLSQCWKKNITGEGQLLMIVSEDNLDIQHPEVSLSLSLSLL